MVETRGGRLDSFIGEVEARGVKAAPVGEYYGAVSVTDYDSWRAPFDMWPYNIVRQLAGLSVPAPIYVVKPSTPGEVAEVLRIASIHGVCVVPVCGLSNVVGATEPAGECVFLDTSGLDRILEFNPVDRYVVVEAGVRIAKLIEWLEGKGYTLTYRPQSERLACVGGSITMQGAGAYSPPTGNIEGIILWAEVATPAGDLVVVGSRRNPRGIGYPGVGMALLGSEGGYGVITRVALRVYEKPEYTVDLAFTVEGFDAALEAARRLYSWDPPLLVRVQDERESQLNYSVDASTVLVRVAGPRSVAEAKAEYASRVVEGLGGSRVEGVFEEWWRARYSYSEYMRMVLAAGLAFDTIDFAAYWSVLPRLHRRLRETLDSTRGVSVSFSHASHFNVNGGALYTTVVFERDPQVYWSVWGAAVEAVESVGASIVHHHGFGALRSRWAEGEYAGTLRLAQALKAALDPKGTLASGILGVTGRRG